MTEAQPHPARTMPFDALMRGLADMREQRLVAERTGPDGLRLYIYTDRCVFQMEWNAFTMVARGLVIDPAARAIVATPFPKFFNLGERDGSAPDLPFEVMDKLDGSLIIIFHHGGRWLAVTKGAFDSAQALWAQERLDAMDLSPLQPGTTYLAEAIYPENRIVVRYDDPALVLLAAYRADGSELSYGEVEALAVALAWPVAQRRTFASMADLLTHTAGLPKTEEGFVIRFENGLRLKIKGAEYRGLHALISRVTPLAVWELMQADELGGVREELPEEFWSDFDAIVALLQARLAAIRETTRQAAAAVAHLTDKELGPALETIAENARPFIFAYRRKGDEAFAGLSRQKLFRMMRPDGNVLPGYVPSYAINRVLDEAG